MTTYVIPPTVTEHEDAHYWPNGAYDGPGDEDCVFCSGLMQFLASRPGGAPATLYEAERIREAAGLGPSGPASSDDLIRGTKKRYGWAPERVAAGFDALWKALDPGMSATASGKPSSCALTSPFRRFLRSWPGGHRVFIERLDATDRVWLMDPEGPKKGYRGQWATKAQLRTFVAHGSSHTVAAIAAVKEEYMPLETTSRSRKLATWTKGLPFFDLNGASGGEMTTDSPKPRLAGPQVAIDGKPFRLVTIRRNAGALAGKDQLVAVPAGDARLTLVDEPTY